ncbi:MAG TPA: DUF3037 domain-containing protein [Ktedonobacteraceae bacterium]|nr:DUF3037 domain-containing protein [Ktedonobacteraceae bacterium]
MPERSSYDYAIIRVVPRVERGECMNAGVILFSRACAFLGVLIYLDEARLLALAPDIDLIAVREQLQLISLIGAGKREAGTIARMSRSERFRWLVSPRSTIIQTSPVHSGLCSDPEEALKHLLQTMVQPV